MTPRTPRLSRVLVLSVVLLSLLAAAACATTKATLTEADGVEPSPSVTEITPSPTPSPTPPPSLTPNPPAGASPTLSQYLARIPSFPAPPIPVAVALPRGEGRAAWQYEIPTTHKVAFITIDDGLNRHPMALDLVRAANVPVTLFLTTNFVSGNTDYFRQIRDSGRVQIEGHTVSHPSLTGLSYWQQKQQLCQSSDLLEKWYGRRPVLFRPPFGEKNDDTLRAAWDCGLKAGFHWRETVDAGIVRYQRTDKRVHAGDIILMHFRPAFPDDFIAALRAIKDAGLTPALLEDYVDGATPAAAPPPPAPTTTPPPTPPTAPAA